MATQTHQIELSDGSIYTRPFEVPDPPRTAPALSRPPCSKPKVRGVHPVIQAVCEQILEERKRFDAQLVALRTEFKSARLADERSTLAAVRDLLDAFEDRLESRLAEVSTTMQVEAGVMRRELHRDIGAALVTLKAERVTRNIDAATVLRLVPTNAAAPQGLPKPKIKARRAMPKPGTLVIKGT